MTMLVSGVNLPALLLIQRSPETMRIGVTVLAAAAPISGRSYACAFRPSRAEQPASNSNSASSARPQVESVGTDADEDTVTVYVERLLVVFESGVVLTTVAVLSNGPNELGLVRTSAMVVEPPEAIVPRAQVTVPTLEEQGDVAETNEVPAGKMSVTVTPAAALGPAFLTTMV
jgi:hypothetical protein